MVVKDHTQKSEPNSNKDSDEGFTNFDNKTPVEISISIEFQPGFIRNMLYIYIIFYLLRKNIVIFKSHFNKNLKSNKKRF